MMLGSDIWKVLQKGGLSRSGFTGEIDMPIGKLNETGCKLELFIGDNFLHAF
jgi:hypothetical protein